MDSPPSLFYVRDCASVCRGTILSTARIRGLQKNAALWQRFEK
jgi:hypothetical protein